VARILAFTSGPEDWQALLADPLKHWKKGYSARTLAHCWEAADGFPAEVARALGNTHDPELGHLEPVLAVPEFKVPLPGGIRSSQNDLFVMARSSQGSVSVMVEGKVNESFDKRIGEWLKDASPGKERRLKFLLKTLGLEGPVSDSIRYQLLHRAASAIISGEQYRAVAAVMVIHSFSQERTGWSDYRDFLALFGVDATEGKVQRLSSATKPPLFAAWVVGDPAFLSR